MTCPPFRMSLTELNSLHRLADVYAIKDRVAIPVECVG